MRTRPITRAATLAACLAALAAAACQPPAPSGEGGPTASASPPATTTTTGQPATAAADPGKAPKLQVAEPSWDAGVVSEGETIKHVFILRNVGTDVLHIKRAKGS